MWESLPVGGDTRFPARKGEAMRWTREQYLDLMTFGQAERPMLTEMYGLLVGLEEEWRRQGASESEISLDAFDFDVVEYVNCGANTGLLGGCEPRVLEQTDDYIIRLDEFGRRTKLYTKVATIPLPLDHPVTDMDSWLKIKHWFTFREERIRWDDVEAARRAQREGKLVRAAIPGGFDLPRQLMGEEATCICYYDDPELMQDIMDTITDTCFQVLDRISDRLVIDNLSVAEDLAGKSGPLVGPKLVARFIQPYYRKIWDMLQAKGARLFNQDSDGNLNAVVEAFLDCGVNVMQPMEPAAYMDTVALRKKFGNRLALKGGIDKHVLRAGKAAILKELEYKLQDCMRTGMVFGLDHRITNGTPIENYRFYVDTAREILGMEPRRREDKWTRMAF